MRSPDLGRLRRLIDEIGWRHMVIGGLAVAARGRPRLTADADVTVEVPQGAEGDLVERSRAAGFLPLAPDAVAFARVQKVLPLADEDGNRVDIVLAGSPYESQAIARATEVVVGGIGLRIATAEDLVIHKIIAGRPRDLDDARGVVRRSGRGFDQKLVREIVLPLAESIADDAMRRRLEEVLASAGEAAD